MRKAAKMFRLSLLLVCFAFFVSLSTSSAAHQECQPRNPPPPPAPPTPPPLPPLPSLQESPSTSTSSPTSPPLNDDHSNHRQKRDSDSPPDPDLERSIYELVEAHGYHLEVHTVQTADGYTLMLHRLRDGGWAFPGQTASEAESSKLPARKPVIVQHGLFGSSADFLISSPFLRAPDGGTGDNLAFALHLTGRYDVWLSNSRGNEYSTDEYRPKYLRNESYWRYSFDQMATYDLPAVTDYILTRTNSSTLGYISYSQGTAIAFALLSLRPHLADLLRPVITMAPVTTVRDIEPVGHLKWLAEGCLHFYFNCWEPDCWRIPAYLTGPFWKSSHINRTRIPVYEHFAISVSSWELLHWSQLILSGRFSRFSYATEAENVAAYGRPVAPDFPLERISRRAVVALVRSTADGWSTVPNQERLIRVLRRAGVTLIDYVVPDDDWAHTDFVHGVGVGRLVYDKVIEVLDQYA